MKETNLFENLSSLTLAFPINDNVKFIESYFKVNYNVDYLKDEKLQKYIDILLKKYKNFKSLTNLDKIKLIKDAHMHTEFSTGKFKQNNFNPLILDFLLLKEIQVEQEKNENDIKFLKTAFLANTGKKSTKKFSFYSKDKIIQKKNETIYLKNNKGKKINNYSLEKFSMKKSFYNNNKNNTTKELTNILYISKIIEKLNDRLIIWIDENYDNEENSSYLKLIQRNKNLNLITFHNVQDAFEYIFSQKENKINEFKFREIFVLISGRLYPLYYKKLEENKNKITFLPICCIFTSYNLAKEIKIDTIKYKEIESPFYNKEGVKTNFIDCIGSFEKFISFYNQKINKISNKNVNINVNKSYEHCLTFEKIYSKKQLVLPFLFNEMMENKNIIQNDEITDFENFILNNFKQEKIQKIIIPMLYIKDIPREIISKLFTRMYTEQTLFFAEVNKSLMKKEKIYDTFVKVMYEGLSIGSLQQSKNEILYRGAKMKKDEIENIRKLFEDWKNTEDKKLPKFLLYSRTFLSFTKSKEIINQFIGKNDDLFCGIVFLVKNNENITKKYSSNADIENLSKYPDEKEVLFFPYTTFYLKNIYEQNYENKNCVFMELEYLGKYEYIYKQFKSDKQFQNDVKKSIHFSQNNNYNEVINSDLFTLDNNPKEKTNNNFVNNFLSNIKKVNNKIITINFLIESEKKYSIKCPSDIIIKKLISKFYEILNCKLTLDELKGLIPFLFNDKLINQYFCSSKRINELEINDGTNILLIDPKNWLKSSFDNKNSEFLSFKSSVWYCMLLNINTNLLINEIINDLKELKKPLPKITIIFRTVLGDGKAIVVNHGTTIDQLCKIYLRRVFVEDENNKIIFLCNACKLKRDNTPVERFFPGGYGKVIVLDSNYLIEPSSNPLMEKLESFFSSQTIPVEITMKFKGKEK